MNRNDKATVFTKDTLIRCEIMEATTRKARTMIRTTTEKNTPCKRKENDKNEDDCTNNISSAKICDRTDVSDRATAIIT